MEPTRIYVKSAAAAAAIGRRPCDRAHHGRRPDRQHPARAAAGSRRAARSARLAARSGLGLDPAERRASPTPRCTGPSTAASAWSCSLPPEDGRRGHRTAGLLRRTGRGHRRGLSRRGRADRLMERALPFAVLISGRGTNMLALGASRGGGPDRRTRGRRHQRPRGCRGPCRGAAPGSRRRSRRAGARRRSRGPRAMRLTEILERHGAELVALAGFMRILDAGFVRRWQGRLLNIHPSLLPAYRGLHTHRRVLEAGDPRHGCTVHFVTEELDAGPAVIQGRLAVRPGDTEESLSARVQQLEHIIYPRAVGWFAAGRLRGRTARPCSTAGRSTAPGHRGCAMKTVGNRGAGGNRRGRRACRPRGRAAARAIRRGLRRQVRQHVRRHQPHGTAPRRTARPVADRIAHEGERARPADRGRHARAALDLPARSGRPAAR